MSAPAPTLQFDTSKLLFSELYFCYGVLTKSIVTKMLIIGVFFIDASFSIVADNVGYTVVYSRRV